MSLEAIERMVKWVTCPTCQGDGYIVRDYADTNVGLVAMPCECNTCDGTGAVVAEKSGEPEDYLEPEDPS